MKQHLARAWRVVGTAIGFTMFGLGGLMLSHIIYILISLLVRDPTKKVKTFRKAITLSFKCFRNTMIFLRVYDVKYEGLEKLKEYERCVIIANHPSLIDYVLLGAELSNFSCLVKSSLLKNPFFGKVISGANYIPNDNESSVIDLCNEQFNEGDNILIFPEGTRTTTTDISKIKAKRGAANIALRCETKVVVLKISLSEHFLAKGQKWYDVPAKMPVYSFSLVNEIPKEEVTSYQDEMMSKAVRHLNRRFFEELFSKDHGQDLSKARTA